MDKTILIIEDEMYIREMYEYVLKQKGYAILSAIDGEQGLVEAQKKPHLILLDIMMPKINGMDVLKKLKEDQATKDIPVILITNLAEKSIIEQAFVLGAQGYILKVRFDPEQVAQTVKLYIDNPKYMMNIDSAL